MTWVMGSHNRRRVSLPGYVFILWIHISACSNWRSRFIASRFLDGLSDGPCGRSSPIEALPISHQLRALNLATSGLPSSILEHGSLILRLREKE